MLRLFLIATGLVLVLPSAWATKNDTQFCVDLLTQDDIIKVVGRYDSGFHGIRTLTPEQATLIAETAHRMNKDPVAFAAEFRQEFKPHGRDLPGTLRRMEVAWYTARGETFPVPLAERIVEEFGEYDGGMSGIRTLTIEEAELIIQKAKALGKEPLGFSRLVRLELEPWVGVRGTLKRIEREHYEDLGRPVPVPVEESIIEAFGEYHAGMSGMQTLRESHAKAFAEAAGRLERDPMELLPEFRKAYIRASGDLANALRKLEEAHYSARGEQRPIPPEEAIIAEVGEYDTGFSGIQSLSRKQALLVLQSAQRLGMDPVEFARIFREELLKRGGYSTLFDEGHVRGTLIRLERGLQRMP